MRLERVIKSVTGNIKIYVYFCNPSIKNERKDMAEDGTVGER